MGAAEFAGQNSLLRPLFLQCSKIHSRIEFLRRGQPFPGKFSRCHQLAFFHQPAIIINRRLTQTGQQPLHFRLVLGRPGENIRRLTGGQQFTSRRQVFAHLFEADGVKDSIETVEPFQFALRKRQRHSLYFPGHNSCEVLMVMHKGRHSGQRPNLAAEFKIITPCLQTLNLFQTAAQPFKFRQYGLPLFPEPLCVFCQFLGIIL